MSPDAAPLPAFQAGNPRDVELDGTAYVLVPKAEFERLRVQLSGLKDEMAALAEGAIGRGLRARRKRAGMTLRETAQRAGIRLETLSRIENGRTSPALKTVQAVLRALEGGR